MDDTGRQSEAASARVIRLALHRWLTTIAARVRPRDPDILLDRVKPGGEVARAFLEAGLALLRAGRIDAACATLERGVRAYPEDLALIQAVAPIMRESWRLASVTAYWEGGARQAPDDPRMVCGLSASLRANFQAARASSIIEAAVERHAEDPGVIAEAARVASSRGRHERALHLWSDLVARGTALPEALAGKAEAIEALGTLATKRAEAPAPRDPSIPEVIITQGDLMLEFESLGDNCEFGLAQRYSGVDPLGLFRFSESQAVHLDQAFSDCFAIYGTDEDLILEQRHADLEYLGSSRHYGWFTYHTEVYGRDVDEDQLRKTELRKLAYLKQRMLSDVRSGEKIFVRKQGAYFAAMDLSRTIRDMGPNVFLWVDRADDDHPVGHVEVVEPGLLKGYISKFAWYGNAHALELHDWVVICLNALRLAKAHKGQQVRYRLVDSAILRTGLSWDIAKSCHARLLHDPSLDGSECLEVTLASDEEEWDATVAEQIVEASLVAGSPYVFSLWVLVPAAFRGSSVHVFFKHAPAWYARRANLDQRDVWQRIYAPTKIPRGCERANVGLRVAGQAGDVIYIATWCLETGFVPMPLSGGPA